MIAPAPTGVENEKENSVVPQDRQSGNNVLGVDVARCTGNKEWSLWM